MASIDHETKLDFSDVLIRPSVSATALTRKDINIKVDYGYFKGVPIIISNMLQTGTYRFAQILHPERMLVFLHKEYSEQDHAAGLAELPSHEFVGFTSGVQPFDIEKTIRLFRAHPGVRYLNIDIANVYANLSGLVEAIKTYRREFPDLIISAGNICSPDPIAQIAQAGANIIKIGVGSGAACKTRSEVGVGVPQFSAILDCIAEAKRYGLRIISDGGCVVPGDIAKALGAGADFVMIAGMVSKAEECDHAIEVDGKKFINLFGLGSSKMFDLTKPTQREYRPNEGRDLLVPCTGPLMSIINQIKGGLRSTCTYTGNPDLTGFIGNGFFVRVNNQINKSLERFEQK